ADGAGERCRLANGAARVGGCGGGAKPGAYGRCGATRGAAGDELGVGALRAPGVHDGAVIGRLVGRAHGELVHVELAQHDGAVAPQIGGDGRLVFRLEAVEDVARSLRMDASGPEEVLDAKGNALERTTLPCRESLVRGLRHLAGLVRC